MKTPRFILSLLALAFALAVPSLDAEPAKEKKVGKRILKKFDADQDGKLSPEEKAAWEADKARKREEKAKKKAEAEAAK